MNYETLKLMIEKGGYKLQDMLDNITLCKMNGKITMKQATELFGLAAENADKDYASEDDFRKEISDRVDKLERLVEKLIKGDEIDPGDTDIPTTEEYPPYKKPSGAHDAYYRDDKCSFEGKNYICVAPANFGVDWNPSENTQIKYWELVE